MNKVNNEVKDRSEAMGQGKIWPLLWRFSAPSVISMLVVSSYNIVDAIWIGRLGSEALAAMAIVFPLMIIYMAAGMGVAVGSASLISRRLGSGQREEADRAVGAGITLFLILSIILTVIFYPNLESVLSVFGATGEVLTMAVAYMRIDTIFITLSLLLIVLSEMVRAEGRPVLSSTASIVSGVLNCILDPLFIFGWGIFPEMGIAGAAVATTIGRGIGVIILLFYLLSGRLSYRLRLSYFKPVLRVYLDIFRIGFTVMIRNAGGSFVQILATRSAASFGVIPLALLGVVFRILSFGFMPCVGVSQAIMPLVGYNYGAKKYGRISEIVVKAGAATTGWAIICWVAVMVAARPILSLFGSDAEYLEQGAIAFRLFAAVFFTVGVQVTISALFQGLGRALPALIVGSARQVIFLVPAVLILPRLLGVNGLWLSFPVADVLGIIVSILWGRAEFHRMGLQFNTRPLLYGNQVSVADDSPKGK